MNHLGHTPAARLVAMIAGADECWQWRGYIGKLGYGSFWQDGRMMPAHRAAYEMLVGPVPDDLELDHLCRNRACVNPDHLEPVTHQENCRRKPGEDRCPSGHARPRGERCRTCKRDDETARRRRRGIRTQDEWAAVRDAQKAVRKAAREAAA